MKTILTILFAIVCIGSHAQTLKLDEQLAAAKTKTGDQLLITNGNTKLYTSIKQGKVTNYFAIGTNNAPVPVSTKKTGTVCQVCIQVFKNGNESLVCYDIDCKDLVKPVNTKH